MNRRTLFRALAALATLPLFGKAVGAEAAPEPAPQKWVLHGDFSLPMPGTVASSRLEGSHCFGAFYHAGNGVCVRRPEFSAASECAAQGGDFERLSKTEWRCILPPDPDIWARVIDYYPDSDMLDYSTTRYEWVPRSIFH